jgi:hypothetical protein
MTRDTKTRRRSRRARKLREQEAQEKAAEDLRANPTPINFSRLFQTFSTMSFRSHVVGGTRPFADYVLGPHANASNPQELAERTDHEHVVQSLTQKPC